MERLWAPWRMEYIKNKDKNRKCVLCQYSKIRALSPSLILARNLLSYVVLNKYPYISGHLMVVPCRHVAKLEELSRAEGLDIFLTIQKTIRVLNKTVKPQGINIGINLGQAAGAGITEHLHYHIVPRWGGDTNFMSVIGQTRVISEDLKKTYSLLAPHFKR